jgi:hypothetical protein
MGYTQTALQSTGRIRCILKLRDTGKWKADLLSQVIAASNQGIEKFRSFKFHGLETTLFLMVAFQIHSGLKSSEDCICIRKLLASLTTVLWLLSRFQWVQHVPYEVRTELQGRLAEKPAARQLQSSTCQVHAISELCRLYVKEAQFIFKCSQVEAHDQKMRAGNTYHENCMPHW